MSILELQQGHDIFIQKVYRDIHSQGYAQVLLVIVSYPIGKVDLCPSIHQRLNHSSMPVLRGEVKGRPTTLHQTVYTSHMTNLEPRNDHGISIQNMYRDIH